MSDAVLKNARVNLEALRRHNQHVEEAHILHVAGGSVQRHASMHEDGTKPLNPGVQKKPVVKAARGDEAVTTGASAQHANRGNAHVQQHEDEVTDVNVREIGGYGFATTAQPVSPTPSVLPGPADIPPTGQGPATPSGQGSVGHRTGGAMGVDAICSFTKIGSRE